MKTISKFAILPALLIGLASVAYADSIQIGSYGTGDPSLGNANTPLFFVGTSPLNPGYATTLVAPVIPTSPTLKASYDVNANGVWSNAISGSSWVSNNAGAGPAGALPGGSVVDPNGFYYYATAFTAVGGLYYGSLSVLADDTAEVILDPGTPDQQILVAFGAIGGDGHCADGSPNCSVVDMINFSDLKLLAGINTLEIIDAQTGLNAAGVDFSADLTKTPEPSSLLLMGSGLLGLAMIAFRKAKAARLSVHS
jgi:hypothetical protein